MRLLCYPLTFLTLLQFPLWGQDPLEAPAQPGPEKIAEVEELARKLALSVEGAIVDEDGKFTLGAVGPIYTYVDADASGTLWLCHNDADRPEAILAVSSWRNKRFIEAHAFSRHQLEFKILGAEWHPAPAREPIAIPDAAPPSEEEPIRLKQMQKLLDRFSCFEEWPGKPPTKFDILPTPAYRYPDSTPDNDGAVFAIVRDRDPEAVLIIETSKDSWQYMLGRMSANPMSYQFDGKRTPIDRAVGRNSPYFFLRRGAEPADR